ncbi:MAG: redoxin domain-containing protein [Bacteroidales bacterium]|nr:redoxin domain-containing protein [Bacteroidales bacterium]
MKKEFLILLFLIIPVIQMNSQDSKTIRIPLIGDEAPSFKGQSTNGIISFPDDFGTSWKILFSHPRDFTPVCSTELLELAQQQEDYEKLGVQIIVLSTDVLTMHTSWVKALEAVKYKDREPVKIKFPLVADDKFLISKRFGMIHPSVSTSENVRGVFIIDPDNKIRSINFYPMQVGRNMDEIKRTVMALQTVYSGQIVHTPANWMPGDKVILPVLSKSEKEHVGGSGSAIDGVSWFMHLSE